MGANGSKSFQQVGSVATGLTSWMSGARKRRANEDTNGEVLNGRKQHQHGDDTSEESPVKRQKTTKNEGNDESEEVDSQHEEAIVNGSKELDNGKDASNGLVHHADKELTVNLTSDVDEGVGLDVTDDENSPLLNPSKDDTSGPSEETNGTKEMKEDDKDGPCGETNGTKEMKEDDKEGLCEETNGTKEITKDTNDLIKTDRDTTQRQDEEQQIEPNDEEESEQNTRLITTKRKTRKSSKRHQDSNGVTQS
ncbi:uncharacterized protein [Amphiura filiformis]|uniref:uncharacterized protein n=1 Tax=Amphiura filiformis TaxID=82378 RepID=UPI003B224A74